MPAITSGPEVVRLLKESGTPDAKLKVARDLLTERYRQFREIASAADVVVALEATLGPDHMTCEKARQFAATGRYTAPTAVVSNEVPIEEQLLRGGPVDLPEPRLALPADPAAAAAPTAADFAAVMARLDALQQSIADRTAENLALRTAADEANTRATAAEAAIAEAKAAAPPAAGEGDKGPGEPTTTSPPTAPPASGPRGSGRK